MRHLSLLLLLALSGVPTRRVEGLAPAPDTRDDFLKLLDRPRVHPNMTGRSDTGVDNLTTERVSIATEKDVRVPILMIRKAGIEKPRPAVIVLHGTGGTKENMRGTLVELAQRGMIGVAIDARYHGERVGVTKGAEAYNAAILKAYRAKPEEMEHPFYYDTVWDILRVVDWLCSRLDVDRERIGMIGFSMGGIQTWLAASVDTRIKAAVPAIAVQSFQWSLENERWQGRANSIKAAHEGVAKDLGAEKVDGRVCRALWTKVIPGILDRFDCPEMLKLFAGRALLIVSGDQDPNCPVEGARLAIAAAEEAYRAAGCPEKLKVMVAEGVGHKVTPEQHAAALAWFERWLN
ncbi:MAG TPA: alpha/beta fold hydrolase [Planctomycetota bacterium]